MKIGRYQLENLVREGVRFIFADLRSVDQQKAFSDPLLERALPMDLAALETLLLNHVVPLDAAILLLSEDGKDAGFAAEHLETAGYKNVYILRDGVAALR